MAGAVTTALTTTALTTTALGTATAVASEGGAGRTIAKIATNRAWPGTAIETTEVVLDGADGRVLDGTAMAASRKPGTTDGIAMEIGSPLIVAMTDGPAATASRGHRATVANGKSPIAEGIRTVAKRGIIIDGTITTGGVTPRMAVITTTVMPRTIAAIITRGGPIIAAVTGVMLIMAWAGAITITSPMRASAATGSPHALADITLAGTASAGMRSAVMDSLAPPGPRTVVSPMASACGPIRMGRSARTTF